MLRTAFLADFGFGAVLLFPKSAFDEAACKARSKTAPIARRLLPIRYLAGDSSAAWMWRHPTTGTFR
jgi:hypothetical protein